ncbi:MAG: hypothetical protein VX498_07175 [Myxococcota bacterium]|nr:hypothetical protein [Myxococcota bacterium]
MKRLCPVLLVLLLLPFSEAGAEESSPTQPSSQIQNAGKNCLGQGRPRATMSHLLGFKYGPIGMEHRLRIGVCRPVFSKPGLLFERSFFEAGFQQHTSPVYAMPGGYMNFAPLSFLVFSFEAAPVFYWPIGMKGAGYYPLDGYQADYLPDDLPAKDGGSALGWYLRGGVTLQFAGDLGPIRLIFIDSVQVERWSVGPAEHYFLNRNDLPAANPEGFVDNSAILLVEVPVHPNARLRIGATDQLTANFGAGQVSNVLGGVVMVNFDRMGDRIRDFTPIVRLGVRTHHPMRQGDFNIILALAFSVDLSREVEARN